ncbi:MAG TPA: DEAD/DEAH box helicase [Panacibacter sp.]|nr:DEAD/DEAH box helicase [Panacibacter sp.]HNP46438.1 DEAD/DEAH box helicase [Panacibacter sp.]
MQQKKQALEKALAALDIDALNAMQEASLQANAQHADVILVADTGTGKTLAFLLPVLQLFDSTNKKTQAMIIVPSRELALQVEQVFKRMSTGFKITCCYGGHARETEENNLVQPPALIVGTPGRIADHIRRGNITTPHIETLVLDEFDKSLEAGFEEEMSFIIQSLPSVKKRILTSATTAVSIPGFAGMSQAVKLDYSTGEVSQALLIQTVSSPDKDKIETLFRLLCYLGGRPAIVFCNHREAVERSSQLLRERDLINVFYHGAMEQQERDAALCKFRNGTSNILVTTDLAARGLDIPGIRYIIHYHLPATEDVFKHRNGRTARMDATGTAIVILSPAEKMPAYVTSAVTEINLPEETQLPAKPKWSTVFIAAGKKDKVNKVDIVGFLGNKGQLKKEDIGLIEVKDFFSFVAIRKTKMQHTLQLIKYEKIKNKKVKIDIAR